MCLRAWVPFPQPATSLNVALPLATRASISPKNLGLKGEMFISASKLRTPPRMKKANIRKGRMCIHLIAAWVKQTTQAGSGPATSGLSQQAAHGAQIDTHFLFFITDYFTDFYYCHYCPLNRLDGGS